MENNDKKMTFPDFMNNYRILIPVIQRDYAQGRRNAPKSIDVRASFIPALKDAVFNKKDLSLDFIYGLKENDKLLLLDGQQRITTLLLFAWYCQKHSQKWNFNYVARSVDDEFITQLLKTKFDYSSSPSEFVMKQNWYFASWQDDPTVSGMLCMLDEIHKHFESADASTADFSKISFYIHVLCSATTTAEYNKIFLKMNARGKALDDWENTKAVLDMHVPENFKDQWSEQINNWQESLWQITSVDNLNAHIKVTNEIMHRIVKTVLRRCYRQIDKDGYDLLNYELDEWLSDNTDKKELFYVLCQRYFDAACSTDFKHYWTTLRSEHPLWNDDAKNVKKDYFFDIIKDRVSYANSLKYAFLVEYRDNQKIQPRQKRILLNLLDNTNVDKENFYELCDNGLAFLRGEKELSNLGFNQTQTEDENRKQAWAEDEVKNIECNPLIWQGSCSFLYYDNKEEYTIDNIKNNLSGIKNLIEQDWKSFFCNILSQISYENRWFAIPEKVRIPLQNEILWAEYIFANHKENMRKWLQKLMQTKNSSYSAWLKYFKDNILEKYNEKYNDLKYVKFTQGWNYCVPDNKITNGSIRLPWNCNETINFEKLETLPIKWDMHKRAYCKAKDGDYYYKIDDESWWDGQTPKKFIKNESGEFIEQQMNN